MQDYITQAKASKTKADLGQASTQFTYAAVVGVPWADINPLIINRCIYVPNTCIRVSANDAYMCQGQRCALSGIFSCYERATALSNS